MKRQKEPKIVVDRKVLRGFRRRALAVDPKEHAESLWGKAEGGRVFVYCCQPFHYRSTEGSVTISEESVEEDREAAKDAGMAVVGTIHTHPDSACKSCGAKSPSDCSPSETDWTDMHEAPEIVLGVATVHRNKQRRSVKIRFYLAHSPLKVKVR